MPIQSQTISQTNLFKGVSPTQIEELLSKVEHKVQDFEKGDVLARQDELCNHLIILLQGSVEAEMEDPSGKVVKVEDITAPSPLAILFLFGQENRFPVRVTASKPVKALILPRETVVKILQLNEKILINYLNISAHYATSLSKKLHLMSFRTIRQKLALYFLEQIDTNQERGTLDRTQVALAEYFGVSRPALARELANMQNEGLITLNKRQFEIIDRNQLTRLISF